MAADKELLAGVALEDDLAVEPKLRPQTLAEYIGQTKARENLAVFLAAAAFNIAGMCALWLGVVLTAQRLRFAAARGEADVMDRPASSPAQVMPAV